MLPHVFPDARNFTPGSGEPVLRWGILAPGGIATAFAQSVRQNTSQKLAGVASRSVERARAFASAFGVETVFPTYEALVSDPQIDVVYVAAPASEHLDLGLLALAAGKHVLIEKPLATSAADARRLVDAARAGGRFLMEAMWSRYLPQASVVHALVSDGVIGSLRGVIAEHCQSIPADPTHRLYRADLGGGALLDLGIYPIQLDSMLLGAPRSMLAVGEMTDTGVDAHATLVLDHGPGVQSTLITSMLARTASGATIVGESGRIEIEGPHHIPSSLTLRDNDLHGPRLTWKDPTGVTGYGGLSWEANAFATFLGEGRTESPLHTLDETVAILDTIDEARRQLSERRIATSPAGTSRGRG
jgi:predicted dehydrogenase